MTTSVLTDARAVAAYGGRWFSPNPSKAWGEKFFLLYTPYWILGMALLMQSGAGAGWGDAALNLAMLVLFAPLVLVPALSATSRASAAAGGRLTGSR
jgi:cycloeucalenol cycloisomerase